MTATKNSPQGFRVLNRTTKVMATRLGYYGQLREPGDVFYVHEGTSMEPGCWFEVVSEQTATTEEAEGVEQMSVPEIKVELAKRGIDFGSATKKTDLAALLIKARNEDAEELG